MSSSKESDDESFDECAYQSSGRKVGEEEYELDEFDNDDLEDRDYDEDRDKSEEASESKDESTPEVVQSKKKSGLS